MRTKLLIVGRTSTGKDSVANYICNKYNLKKLKSYSTRPKRYEDEDTHIFISKLEAMELMLTQEVIAYTKIGEYEYFGTYQQFLESDIYVIDPNGVNYFKEKYQEQLKSQGINILVMYVHTYWKLRESRAKLRGDNYTAYQKRIVAEDLQFNKFEVNKEYDFIICNDEWRLAEEGINKLMSKIKLN